MDLLSADTCLLYAAIIALIMALKRRKLKHDIYQNKK